MKKDSEESISLVVLGFVRWDGQGNMMRGKKMYFFFQEDV